MTQDMFDNYVGAHYHIQVLTQSIPRVYISI